MNVETKLRDFMNEYKSFVMNDVYYMRGWIDEKNLCLMRDWFDVLYTTIHLADISNATVSSNELTLNYIVYEDNNKKEMSISIIGYDAICEINDKIFPFKNIYRFEDYIWDSLKLVDEEYSGKMNGNIYCVLDLFRLGRLNFNEITRLKKPELFGYFSKELKAGKLHTNNFNDTLTIYHACEDADPYNNWYGLWSVTKQIPLTRIEFSEKISKKFLKKVLTNSEEQYIMVL